MHCNWNGRRDSAPGSCLNKSKPRPSIIGVRGRFGVAHSDRWKKPVPVHRLPRVEGTMAGVLNFTTDSSAPIFRIHIFRMH